MDRDLAAETSGAVTKMLNRGVEHRDIRPPNVLWNPEIRNVVLVDFERSEILNQLPVLQETSPNRKRKHLFSTDGASCSIQYCDTVPSTGHGLHCFPSMPREEQEQPILES